MHGLKFTVTSLLAFAASTQASEYLVYNHCGHDVTLRPQNVDNHGAWGAPVTLHYGEQFQAQGIVGTGRGVGVTNNHDEFFSPNSPKMILAANIKDGIMYWSLSNQDGAPFTDNGDFFSVTGLATDGKTTICGSTRDYTSGTHSCPDNGNIILALELCL